MKKLTLNRIASGTPEAKEKIAYEDFIVVENYLIIRESISNLLIYKFSGKDTLTFFKEMSLKNKKQIKSMDAINPNNVFIIYHTNEILIIDIINSTQEEVKIFLNGKISLLNANEVSIHDQCELKDTNKKIYIGFVSVNNNELYLAYKDWKNDTNYILNCISVKKFKDEIIHIEYKFITIKKEEKNKTYCFICVLCKMEGYSLIIEVKEDEYDLNKFISLLNIETNWALLFNENNIISYKYSFYYNINSFEQNSILVFTDENKCMIWNFKSLFTNSNDFLQKTEHIYKLEKEKGHNNTIIDVNHYNNRLFVTTKEDLMEYKLLSPLTTSTNTIKHSNFTSTTKIKIYDVPDLVYILFLTLNDLWYYELDLNEGHHKRLGSSVSLSGIDINESNNKETDSKNSRKNKKENKRYSAIGLGNKNNKEKPSIKQRESIVKNSDNNSQENKIKCSVRECDKYAKYRCSFCKKFFICELGIHNNQWDNHKKTCPNLPQKRKIEYDKLEPYVPLWNKQRVEIVEHLRKKEFSEAIEKNYILIQENYKLLNQYQREGKILPFDDLNLIENNKKDLLNSFQYYEDYFCNFLLLIHTFSLFKSKDEVWRLLNRLIKEMENYNFTGVTNFLIEDNIEKVKSDDNQDNYYSNIKIKEKTFEDIYLRILKILVTIAKYGNSLGEFSFYEKYLLDYTLKILKAYSEDDYINYNTFLLLGNLYVEYGFLQKGHHLFDAIIGKTNNLNNKERLNDVVLCANYNSGLVNFVIDRYEIAKQRFETALRIKKEFLKEKNDLQISQIYETIAEIDIEYKNYNSALNNLQKAIESRELSNTMDVEFKLRTSELRNYINQNLADTKGDLNSNVQFRRGENNEESENEKLVLDLIQDTSINLNQAPDIQELEKFFLFMTKLSISQIDKLNEDQPKDDFEKNKRFPIVFSKNFKNSLTHSQRLALCDLKLTSLTRVNVLKNYTKKISIRNLNYNALNLVPPENNLNSIRNSYVTKTILHNWETRREEELKKVKEDQKSEEEEEEDEENDKIKIPSKENVSYKYKGLEMEDNKSKMTKKEEDSDNNLELTSEENIEDSEDKKDFDYSGLLNSIKKYCEQNSKEKAKYVDNKFLFLLCRQGEMTKEELKRIEKKPELIELLLDTYIDMVKESAQEEKEEIQQQRRDESRELFIQPDTRAIDDGEINREFFNDDNEVGYIPIPPPPPPPVPMMTAKNSDNDNE